MTWCFTEENSFVFVNKNRTSLVDSVSPGKRAGLIKISLVEGEPMVMDISQFKGVHPIIFSKKQMSSRSFFCQRFKEIVRDLRKDISQNTSSTECVQADNTDTSRLLEEQEGYDIDDIDDSSNMVTEDDVLPCLDTNVEYLFNNKLVGSSVTVHLNNLVCPAEERLVRPISTAHVQYLEKSFEKTPGGEFHVMVGNLVGGTLEKAGEAGGAKIEIVGGNHTRLALASLHRRGLRAGTVTCLVYGDLSAEEALKIGIHHNVINTKSRQMSFVETVMVVRRVKEKRQLARIFGYENSRKVKDCLKVHLRLCSLSEDVIQTVFRIDRNWAQKKPLSQTTIRNLLWLEDDQIRQGLACLETDGLKAFKELVKTMKGDTVTGKQVARPVSVNVIDEDNADKDKEMAKLNKAVGDWEKKYECLNHKYSELTVKNQQLIEELEKLKSSNKRHHSAEASSQETPKRLKSVTKTFEVGQKVWAMFSEDLISYPAKVIEITDKGYKVKFVQDGVVDIVKEANMKSWK